MQKEASPITEKRIKELEKLVAELKNAEKITNDDNEIYKIVFENTGTAVIIIEEDTVVSLINSEFESLTGYSKNEVEGLMTLAHFFPEKEKSRVVEYLFLRRMDTPLVPKSIETECSDKTGKTTPIYMAVSILPGSKKSIASILDLTDTKQAEEAFIKQRAYFSQLFNNTPQAILILDTTGEIIDINKGFEALFGYHIEEIKGKQWQQIGVPVDRMEENEAFYQSVLDGNTLRKETISLHKDNKLIHVSVIGFPLRYKNRIDGYYYIYNDISQRKAFEKQLYHQAFHDSLTTMPNRVLFMERLGRAVERAKRYSDYAFAVLLIDLDRFKGINDSLGHLAGDTLLIKMASRFKSCVRNVDTVARLGGDEFAILTEEFKTTQEVIQVAKRIQNVTKLPFFIDDNEVQVSASIGIVLETRNYKTPENILRDADIAMYRAKAQGKARFKVFNKKMHEQVVESLKMENDLRNAIQKQELILHYQPIIAINNYKFEGFEALVRWNHPTLGIIPPSKFISIAEETGLIVPLGQWILSEACQQMKRWRQTFPEFPNFTMNVNISFRQFFEKDLLNFLSEVLRKNNMNPQFLKIELTESVLMDNEVSIIEKLNRMQSLGIKLAIDDFGTGYSSLAYLQQFPLDSLKIDRSFIKKIHEPEGMAIVKTIINLAKNLGLSVVAEGVEKKAQFETLKTIKCDNAQGFLFSRPMNKQAATTYLEKILGNS